MRCQWRGRPVLAQYTLADLAWRVRVAPEEVVVVPKAFRLFDVWYCLVERPAWDASAQLTVWHDRTGREHFMQRLTDYSVHYTVDDQGNIR